MRPSRIAVPLSKYQFWICDEDAGNHQCFGRYLYIIHRKYMHHHVLIVLRYERSNSLPINGIAFDPDKVMNPTDRPTASTT